MRDELEARWSIVETSFTTGVGRSVMEAGLAVNLTEWRLEDRRRRRSVAGVREALIGFQHGRCLLCDTEIGPKDGVVIDHVFPFSLTERFAIARRWPALDLDTVWNLAPVHHECNARKSARPPCPVELGRLAHRNEAIMNSPHPLKRTLEITLATAVRPFTGTGRWPAFVRAVQDVFG